MRCTVCRNLKPFSSKTIMSIMSTGDQVIYNAQRKYHRGAYPCGHQATQPISVVMRERVERLRGGGACWRIELPMQVMLQHNLMDCKTILF